MRKTTAALFIAGLAFAQNAQNAQSQNKPTPTPQAVSKTIHVQWTASVTSGVSYIVYKGFGTCATNPAFSRITATPITTLFYDDVNVGVGQYCYYATSYLSTAIPNESVPSNKADVQVAEPQPQPPTNLNITPPTATLKLNQKQQFAANWTPVNWSIDPVDIGTISGTGLYTAPSSVKGNNVKVTVIASLTGSNSGTAQVTVKK